MGTEVKEVTVEELVGLIQSQQGEFIIHGEPGEEDAAGEAGTVSV